MLEKNTRKSVIQLLLLLFQFITVIWMILPPGVPQDVILWICIKCRTWQFLLPLSEPAAPPENPRHQETVWEHCRPLHSQYPLRCCSKDHTGMSDRGSCPGRWKWGGSNTQKISSIFLFYFILLELLLCLPFYNKKENNLHSSSVVERLVHTVWVIGVQLSWGATLTLGRQ